MTLFVSLLFVASLFFQQSTRWVFQARQMNGKIGSITIEPDQTPLLNAFFLVLFIPIVEYAVIPLLAKIGIKTSLQRITFGVFFASTAFVMAAALQYAVDRQELHMAWQIPQHLVLAFGEVLVYVQLQQFGYTQAPKEMKSVLQSFFAMIIGGGNLIVAFSASIKFFESRIYEFLMSAGLSYASMILFVLLAMRYEYVVVSASENNGNGTENGRSVDVDGSLRHKSENTQ